MEGVVDANEMLILELTAKFISRFGLGIPPESKEQCEDIIEQYLPKFFDFETLQQFEIDAFQFYNNPLYLSIEQNRKKLDVLNSLINRIRETLLLNSLLLGDNYLYLKGKRRKN